MRAVAAAVAVPLMLLASGFAAAAPLPGTREAARGLVHDVVEDADRDLAKALRAARQLVRDVREASPLPPDNARLELRAALLQPIVRGSGDYVSVVWVGADQGYWTGAYWIETSYGIRSPNLIDVSEEGALLFLDEGTLFVGDSVAVAYHFLGIDGRYARHALGRAAILPATPVLERADFGGAVAGVRSGGLDALILTPWSLFSEPREMGLTFQGAEGPIAEHALASCATYAPGPVEPGCRLLYVLEMPEELVRVELWHDEDGARVVDRALTRADLLAGYRFSP